MSVPALNFTGLTDSGFTPQGGLFSGDDWLYRATAFTGITGASKMTGAFYVKPDPTGLYEVFAFGADITGSDSARLQMTLAPSALSLRIGNPTDGYRVTLQTVVNPGADGYLAILFSYDTSAAGPFLAHLYVNDTPAYTSNLGTGPAFTPNVNTDFSCGRVVSFGANTTVLPTWCMKEMYIASNTYIDFSVAANRRKFFDALNKPVNKNSDGSRPTGAKPILYAVGPGASLLTNRGTGGNVSMGAGTLGNC